MENKYGKQREENISKLRGSLFHNSICTESQFSNISNISFRRSHRVSSMRAYFYTHIGNRKVC